MAQSPQLRHRAAQRYYLDAVILGVWFGAVLLFVLRFQFWKFTSDDTFIFFRLADNITSGKGYVWNVSDGPVEAATSVLWLAIICLIQWAGMPVLATVKIAGVAAAIGSIYLLAALMSQLMGVHGPGARRCALVAALAAFTLPYVLLQVGTGMETLPYCSHGIGTHHSCVPARQRR